MNRRALHAFRRTLAMPWSPLLIGACDSQSPPTGDLTLPLFSFAGADTSAPSITPSFPIAVAAGDLLFIAVATKYGTPLTPSGRSLRARAAATLATMFYRIADGSEKETVPVGAGGRRPDAGRRRAGCRRVHPPKPPSHACGQFAALSDPNASLCHGMQTRTKLALQSRYAANTTAVCDPSRNGKSCMKRQSHQRWLDTGPR
jgi:hypothetical protein